MTFNTVLELTTNLTNRILVEAPFTQSELKPIILDVAYEKAIGDLDNYKPQIIKSYGPINDDDHVFIRSYISRFSTTSMFLFSEELGNDIADYYIYQKKWTMEALIIPKNSVALKYFNKLVINYSGAFMSNKRRSAEMNNIPFNIKGDQFYNECMENIAKLIEELINTTDNSL